MAVYDDGFLYDTDYLYDEPDPPPGGGLPGVDVPGDDAYAPVLSPLGWPYLPRYVREADDGTLRDYLSAVGAPTAVTAEVLTDPAVTAGVDATPFTRLPWLAAIAGIDVSTVPADRRRAVVADQDWRFRGTLTAIRKRVGETLTGAKSVEIVTNYGGNPDAISVTTYASQTPDPAATTAAIKAEIPAWMAATIVVNAAGQSYANLAADYATYAVMAATNKTYGTLSQEV